MKIIDHRLQPGWYVLSPNHGGPLAGPSLIVLHATISGGEGPAGDADYFLRKSAKTSAHVVVGRNGELLQVVPFDRKAWHAGASIWRGARNCNDFSLGIEIDNWGKLVGSLDGDLRSTTGQPVPHERAVQLRHKHETDTAWWETYPEVQLASLERLLRLLLATYPSLNEIVGHEDVAPGRKIDPGPAFPMGRFASLASRSSSTRVRTVRASRINARSGPGRDHPVLGAFTRNDPVEVIEGPVRGWSRVRGRPKGSIALTAWVWDQYLL